MKFRDEKVKSLIKEHAANFLAREAGLQSLITVTDVTFSDRANSATVFISVLPTEKEAAALDFVKRKRGELRAYVDEHVRMRAIPRFDFAIDDGEKNRQRIDEITHVIESQN